jgi:hypothetical protein
MKSFKLRVYVDNGERQHPWIKPIEQVSDLDLRAAVELLVVTLLARGNDAPWWDVEAKATVAADDLRELYLAVARYETPPPPKQTPAAAPEATATPADDLTEDVNALVDAKLRELYRTLAEAPPTR